MLICHPHYQKVDAKPRMKAVGEKSVPAKSYKPRKDIGTNNLNQESTATKEKEVVQHYQQKQHKRKHI